MKESDKSFSGYAFGQLRKALRGESPERIRKWESVLGGLETGSLQVGSRTPLDGVPSWVTLEVAHGGFATGRLLAEAPLSPQELEWLDGPAKDVPGKTQREKLNCFFLSDLGLERLSTALNGSRFYIETPEEGALPVVAWLMENGHTHSALRILETIRPWFPRPPFLSDPLSPSTAAELFGQKKYGGPGPPEV